MLKGQDRPPASQVNSSARPPWFTGFYSISSFSLHLHLSFLLSLLSSSSSFFPPPSSPFFSFVFLASSRGLCADVEKRDLGQTGPTPFRSDEECLAVYLGLSLLNGLRREARLEDLGRWKIRAGSI